MEGRSRSLVSREVTRLPISGSDPTYSSTGHILYVGPDGTTLRAVGFDATRLEVTTPSPVPVLENVHSGGFGDTGNFGLADNGSLVYLSGGFTNALRTLALVDRDGVAERLNVPPAPYHSPRVSPDGHFHTPESHSDDGRLSFADSVGGVLGVWTISNEDGAEPEVFVDLPESNQLGSVFSPDGNWIAYHSNETGSLEIYVQPFPPTGAKSSDYAHRREIPVVVA